MTTEPNVWVHRWAVLTVVATLPLLLLGAEVTTKQVGMVDEQGLRTPWHLFTVPLEQAGLGFVIEHSHRIAGWAVGACAIVLAGLAWALERRRWVRWLAAAALVGVSLQGVLGIFRVNLNALVGPELALVHGCFAQLVFALLVSVAVCTSRGWGVVGPSVPDGGVSLRRLSLLTAVLVYGQLVLGAVVRHKDVALGARAHLLFAFAVAAAAVWLARTAWDHGGRDRRLKAFAVLMLGLLGLQVWLGAEAWLVKFRNPQWNQLQPLSLHAGMLRSLHYLTGSLVFATSVALALHAHRQAAPSAGFAAAPVGRLEGAA